jgi:hypothetical protein
MDLPASALLTNSQIVRLLRKRHPGVGNSLGQLVLCFEDSWYGTANVQLEDYGRVDSLAYEVEQVATAEVKE